MGLLNTPEGVGGKATAAREADRVLAGPKVFLRPPGEPVCEEQRPPATPDPRAHPLLPRGGGGRRVPR